MKNMDLEKKSQEDFYKKLKNERIKRILRTNKKNVQKVVFYKEEKENGYIIIHIIKKMSTLSFILNEKKELIEIQIQVESIRSVYDLDDLSCSHQSALNEMFKDFVEHFNLRLKLLLS